MKLKPTADIPSFLHAVKYCQDEVYFTTPEGDVLNLKSILSQFVFAAVISGDMQELSGTINLQNPQDAQCLAEFLTV